jgi:Predicted exosome subunit/U3 small nucleolar ribonucleoprotein (snoRNP) component, contains IMP4 domain
MGKDKIELPPAVHAIPNKREKTFKKLDKPEKKKPTKRSYLHVNPTNIANKMKRQIILFKRKRELKKLKKGNQKLRKQAVAEGKQEKLEPLSIEDKREFDETIVTEVDPETEKEEEMDEFAEYFAEKTTPKILMTTSEKPSGYMFDFLKEIKDVFPNCFYWPRRNYTLQEICKYAPSRGYTDIMVWRENQKEIYQLILIHLNKGPTAFFKVKFYHA